MDGEMTAAGDIGPCTAVNCPAVNGSHAIPTGNYSSGKRTGGSASSQGGFFGSSFGAGRKRDRPPIQEPHRAAPRKGHGCDEPPGQRDTWQRIAGGLAENRVQAERRESEPQLGERRARALHQGMCRAAASPLAIALGYRAKAESSFTYAA